MAVLKPKPFEPPHPLEPVLSRIERGIKAKQELYRRLVPNYEGMRGSFTKVCLEISKMTGDPLAYVLALPITEFEKYLIACTWPEATSKKQGRVGRRKRNAGELTDAQELLAAALREWHGWESESLSCITCAAISYAELCKRSGVSSKSTATEFFGWWLSGGNARYKRLCKSGDAKALAIELAKLSREGALLIMRVGAEALSVAKAKSPGDND